MILIRILIVILTIYSFSGLVHSQLPNNKDTKYVQDKPGGIRINIQVLLMGFEEDGAFKYRLDPLQFKNLLKDSYTIHNVYSLETSIYHLSSIHNRANSKVEKVHNPKELSSHYDITYSVRSLPSTSITRLEHTIATSAIPVVTNSVDDETYLIPVDPLEPFFESEIRLNSLPSNLPTYTILFINPAKERMFKEGIQAKYLYQLQEQLCGPAWIGAGRYLVVDLSAGPLKYGSTLHKSALEILSEGSVDYDSLPRLIEYFQKPGYSGTSLQGASPTEIKAHMSSLVISAIQNVILSDSKYNLIPLFPKILIPVLVFRDHDEYDPLEEGSATSIDVNLIKKEAKRIFPFSEVTVVTGSHSIHEHRHIGMAFSKSIRSHSSFELNPKSNKFETSIKTYIDSEELLLKLKNEDDVLAGGLIGDHVTQIPSVLNQVHRTKILPVYIFSMKSTNSGLLLDKYYLHVANQDAVAVLQTKTSFNGIHYQGKQLVSFQPQSVNRHIIAGLASSQGLLGPTQRYSKPHEKLKNNYLWSYGQHPFGFFGNGTELSQIFIDSITRNTIITTLQGSTDILDEVFNNIHRFSTKYLMDSLGYEIDEMPSAGYLIDRFYHSPPTKLPLVKSTVKRLHDELESIQQSMTESIDILQTINQQDLNQKKTKESVLQKLNILSKKIVVFTDYVNQELNTVESQLQCCAINSVSTKMNSSNTTVILTLLSAIAIFFIALIITRKKNNNNVKNKVKNNK
ncbi:transmembrane protein [Heterostelium album PN500]|uniref:Transmembrane protein n=1 Tax=Heterostelium pallidum (strain ATCC 26659 / Pp 5 / PN500) TaxID=670386 RepID=D3B357_HETP5|nr:transmembrane protein [Heterostelium album PN500]EFA83755.1 transmembrane protein [Heterostelium album PN500]|eukprot:XP_020435872.1 transmembrane protein [Heterostelium album PN500]